MSVNTTYEPYSQEPEYIDTNRALLETLSLDSVQRVVDLACGTGLLSQLLLEMKPDLSVYGVDISEESLAIGRELFRELGLLADDMSTWRQAASSGRGAVLLETKSADELAVEPEFFDLAVMGNAIHLMPDKDKFLQSVHRILAPQARFAFNTVFFVGTFPEGTEPIYTEWLKQALMVLNEKNARRVAEGKAPFPRRRGKGGHAFDKGWLSPEQWEKQLRSNGFEVTRNHRRLIPISRRGLELVGAYGGLAEVLMSGYPVEVASECLQEAVGRAFSKLGVSNVPRYWLEITATRV